MKSKRNAIALSAVLLTLCLALVAGATFALFGQDFDNTVTVSSGGISADVTFENVKTFSMEKETEPQGTFDLGGTAALNGQNELVLQNIVPGDRAEVNLTIQNNQESIAVKYRITVTVGGDYGSNLLVSVDGEGVTSGTPSAWKDLAKGANASAAVSVELDENAGNDMMNKSGTVKITVELIQSNATAEDLA